MIVPLIWSISRLSPMLMSVSPKSLAKSAVATVRRELMVRCHGVDVADVAKLLKTFIIILVTCVTASLPMQTHAKSTKTAKAYTISANDVADIRVTKYELALVQVMAEICPQMLSGRQKSQFYEAYNNQLRAFIPSADDPEEILDYLSTQRDYRAVLQSVRSWTKSFPQNENRELCTDFANVSRAF